MFNKICETKGALKAQIMLPFSNVAVAEIQGCLYFSICRWNFDSGDFVAMQMHELDSCGEGILYSCTYFG